MPPGSAKSTYASILYPAWHLANSPQSLVLGCELLDRGYGRPLQMIDASIMRRKLSELSPDEVEALEARLLSDAAADAEAAQTDEVQSDFFRDTGGGTIN